MTDSGNIPRMPDGSYMTPKDAIYVAGELKPEDIKGHSLICNVMCEKCRNYLPPHTTARHFNRDDPVHKCPDHNRAEMETEAILLLGNARIDRSGWVEGETMEVGDHFVRCGDCYKFVPKGEAKLWKSTNGGKDMFMCPECDIENSS